MRPDESVLEGRCPPEPIQVLIGAMQRHTPAEACRVVSMDESGNRAQPSARLVAN